MVPAMRHHREEAHVATEASDTVAVAGEQDRDECGTRYKGS